MTVGERIKALRTQKGFSQEDVARRAGLTRQSIHLYETDQSDPSLFNAMCIADVLGVSLDYLAKGSVTDGNKKSS